MDTVDDESVVEQAHFFAVNERIGRLRYLAYEMGLGLLMILPLIFGVALTLKGMPLLGKAIAYGCYAAAWVMGTLFTVRRLHDMDASGWWALLIPVPIADLILALVLIFRPGTDSVNRFGQPPSPNTGWVIAGALAYPALIIVGCTTAIFTPLYRDHVVRAQVAASFQSIYMLENEVIAYYKVNGKWPTKDEDIRLPLPSPGGIIQSIGIERDGGIHLIYGRPYQLSGKSVYVMHYANADGTFIWGCSTNVDDKYLSGKARANCAPLIK